MKISHWLVGGSLLTVCGGCSETNFWVKESSHRTRWDQKWPEFTRIKVTTWGTFLDRLIFLKCFGCGRPCMLASSWSCCCWHFQWAAILCALGLQKPFPNISLKNGLKTFENVWCVFNFDPKLLSLGFFFLGWLSLPPCWYHGRTRQCWVPTPEWCHCFSFRALSFTKDRSMCCHGCMKIRTISVTHLLTPLINDSLIHAQTVLHSLKKPVYKSKFPSLVSFLFLSLLVFFLFLSRFFRVHLCSGNFRVWLVPMVIQYSSHTCPFCFGFPVLVVGCFWLSWI